MASAEQLKRLKDGFVNRLWPVYGAMGKREGVDPAKVGHWWAEVLGDYDTHVLATAAQWWLRSDTTGYWPKTPAIIKDWLAGQGYKPRPANALEAPKVDPLASLRKAASEFYEKNVMRVPPEQQTDGYDYVRWTSNRQRAFESLMQKFRHENKIDPKQDWVDVLAIGVNQGAFTYQAMLDEVLHVVSQKQKAIAQGGLAKNLSSIIDSVDKLTPTLHDASTS
jgi:hypothetical protein